MQNKNKDKLFESLNANFILYCNFTCSYWTHFC